MDENSGSGWDWLSDVIKGTTAIHLAKEQGKTERSVAESSAVTYGQQPGAVPSNVYQPAVPGYQGMPVTGSNFTSVGGISMGTIMLLGAAYLVLNKG